MDTGIELIIKLMGDVEKTDKSGNFKKDWVMSQIKIIMPQFYQDHSVLIGDIVDGMVFVASHPEMIQGAKTCSKTCSKLFGCYV